jgi:hypothetical protein
LFYLVFEIRPALKESFEILSASQLFFVLLQRETSASTFLPIMVRGAAGFGDARACPG